MAFRNNVVSLLDATFSRTSNLFGAMSKALERIDTEAQLTLLEQNSASLLEKGEKIFSGLDGLLRQIRENSDLFVVRVPYNQDKEEIDFEIIDNVLTVTKTSSTENSQSKSETTATIPETCNIEAMRTAYNEKKQIMAYIFPKKDASVKTAIKENVEPLKETIKENVEAVAETIKDTVAEAAKTIKKTTKKSVKKTAKNQKKAAE